MEVIIDRNFWLRGSASALMSGDKYCALGKCLLDSGIPKSELVDVAELNDLILDDVDLSSVPQLLFEHEGMLAQKQVVLDVVRINDAPNEFTPDSPNFSQRESLRENMLRVVLEPYGFELKFV